MVNEWLQKIGIRVTRLPPVPAPKGHTPTWLEKVTAPIRRGTFERHPDDPGFWDYPLQRAAWEQREEDRHRSTDWLNHSTPENGWHCIVPHIFTDRRRR